MNNLLSHCGLIDAKIRASDKDLPVSKYVILIKVRRVRLFFIAYFLLVVIIDDA